MILDSVYSIKECLSGCCENGMFMYRPRSSSITSFEKVRVLSTWWTRTLCDNRHRLPCPCLTCFNLFCFFMHTIWVYDYMFILHGHEWEHLQLMWDAAISFNHNELGDKSRGTMNAMGVYWEATWLCRARRGYRGTAWRRASWSMSMGYQYCRFMIQHVVFILAW